MARKDIVYTARPFKQILTHIRLSIIHTLGVLSFNFAFLLKVFYT
jgi:hypothetical protein